MKPIISPWIFYLLDKSNFLDFVSFLGFICSLFGVIEIKLDLVFDNPSNANKIRELYKELKKIFIIFAIVAIITPSKDTLYKMLIASQITPNNINAAGKTITEGIDYIFDKINETIEIKNGEQYYELESSIK